MDKIRILGLSGSYYDMGYQHGKTYHDAIHMFTEDRIELSGSEHWTGRNLSRAAVLALAEACVEEHQAYSPELMQEVQGMADATGLSLAALVINNGFTDFIDVVYNVGDITQKPAPVTSYADNCTAFLVPSNRAVEHHAMLGQTWDMHATATPYVILLRGKPENAPAFLVFTITGCLGMIGMNSAGIAVGINNLLGGDGQIGVTWPFVIRKVLMQTNLEDALACITSAKLAGAHNYLLLDRDGNGYNIEAMSTRSHVDKLQVDPIVHSNHCVIPAMHEVERERAQPSQASTEARLARATELLNAQTITPELLMAVTRDNEAICVRPKPPQYVESCGAAIMRPATGDFWAVWGPPAENEYEHFTLH